MNTTDPDAALVGRKNTNLFYGYKVHIGVDGGSARVVTSVVTITGTVCENQVAGESLDRHGVLTGIKPAEVVGNKRHGTNDLFRLLRKTGVLPTILGARPWHKKRRKRLKAGCRYDASRDVFVCPEGRTRIECVVTYPGQCIA